jgi:D-tyrosyl-tRNA(Tyr) deacylase
MARTPVGVVGNLKDARPSIEREQRHAMNRNGTDTLGNVAKRVMHGGKLVGRSVASLESMRIVLQRVSRASVVIEDRIAGAIERGFCLLVGFTHRDTSAEVDWMAEKVLGLRLFSDEEGKMNLGLSEIGGGLLVISQFTLYGDAQKGRRPSFIAAARPEVAIPLYERFIERVRAGGLRVESGEFGADMQLEIHNDGPVTLVLDRDAPAAG